MKIGVDGSCWANQRGYGRFAREIVAEMVKAAPDDDFICFVDDAAEASLELDAPNVALHRVRQAHSPTTAAAADSARSPFDMLRFTRAVWSAGVDVFFSPSVYTYFPLPPGTRSVVTVHDAIAERFPELTVPSRSARLFWRAKVWLALRQARLVLTVSDYARRDIAAVHGVADHRLRVAVEAPASAYRRSTDLAAISRVARSVGVPEGRRWFAYVGGFNPHKNVDHLVRAHARYAAASSGEPPHLVLVGSTSDVFHGSLEQIRAAVSNAGTEDLVHWPGFLPDAELALLLSGALGLFLVSRAEGFGLPAVEAAACGCPVIATTESPLPELLAGAGIFLEPGDDDALLEALRRFADYETERLEFARVAEARAAALSWPAAARSALAALREAAA